MDTWLLLPFFVPYSSVCSRGTLPLGEFPVILPGGSHRGCPPKVECKQTLGQPRACSRTSQHRHYRHCDALIPYYEANLRSGGHLAVVTRCRWLLQPQMHPDAWRTKSPPLAKPLDSGIKEIRHALTRNSRCHRTFSPKPPDASLKSFLHLSSPADANPTSLLLGLLHYSAG